MFSMFSGNKNHQAILGTFWPFRKFGITKSLLTNDFSPFWCYLAKVGLGLLHQIIVWTESITVKFYRQSIKLLT